MMRALARACPAAVPGYSTAVRHSTAVYCFISKSECRRACAEPRAGTATVYEYHGTHGAARLHGAPGTHGKSRAARQCTHGKSRAARQAHWGDVLDASRDVLAKA